MFAPVTKATLRARTAGEVPALAEAGLRLAASQPTRPVYLEIPTDLLDAPLEDQADSHVEPEPAAPSPPVPDHPTCERIASALTRARRPLIWAGGGALRSGSGPPVARLAELIGAPVIETYLARGLVPLGHPGKVTVSPHSPEVGQLWDSADAVLAIGTDFDGMMTQNWRMPQPSWLGVVNIDERDGSKAYRADELLAADALDGVEWLIACIEAAGSPAAGVSPVTDEVAERERRARAAAAAECPEAATFLATMAGLGPDVVVIADMCIPGYWLAGFHPVAAPRRFAYPMGWGTLGFGFPAAIGAALASELPVVAVVGDGGFLFACGELAVLRQEAVPLTVVIVDDGGYGMLRYDQQRLGRRQAGVDLATPDFAALAAAFGIRSRTVGSLGAELGVAISDGFSSREPNVIVVKAALTPPLSTSPRWYRAR
jgi:acetolactate synthase-1/2/3 large subunit